MAEEIVPDVVISRLPWYLQTLNQLARQGMHTVSSKMLAERLGTTAAQIRKDLSYFGGFGKQGTGYSIYYLIEQLQKILNLDRVWQVVVVGAGDLGRALTRYQGFASRGIEIGLLFDVDPKVIGTPVGSVVVEDVAVMEEKIREKDIKIAILTVPAQAAQHTADKLVAAGVKSILNYAPITLITPESVHVQHIDPVLHLQRMMYYLGDSKA
ncbi:MAG: redox-sensing transcriptional repressor Rex [Anaerolineaceae bacterium]|nr:redox-sensing transcriptional repressor Rex [Anaerolineaceae bacterium]